MRFLSMQHSGEDHQQPPFKSLSEVEMGKKPQKKTSGKALNPSKKTSQKKLEKQSSSPSLRETPTPTPGLNLRRSEETIHERNEEKDVNQHQHYQKISYLEATEAHHYDIRSMKKDDGIDDGKVVTQTSLDEKKTANSKNESLESQHSHSGYGKYQTEYQRQYHSPPRSPMMEEDRGTNHFSGEDYQTGYQKHYHSSSRSPLMEEERRRNHFGSEDYQTGYQRHYHSPPKSSMMEDRRRNHFGSEDYQTGYQKHYHSSSRSPMAEDKTRNHFGSENYQTGYQKRSPMIEDKTRNRFGDHPSKYRQQKAFPCEYCASSWDKEQDLHLHLATVHWQELEEADKKQKQSIGEIPDHSITAPKMVIMENNEPPAHEEFEFGLVSCPQTLKNYQLGTHRGIQGENNSCYLDAYIFACFAVTDLYDSIFDHRELESKELDMIRVRLRTDIVNELRKRGYVASSSVVLWRRMINKAFPGADFNQYCEEKDISDFATFLFKSLNCLDNFPVLHLTASLPPHSRKVITFEELVKGNEFKTEKTWKGVTFVIPRDKQKIFDGVIPTPQFQADGMEFNLISFCCIERSHYVCFAKDSLSNWYLFDSMADRKNNENIPSIQKVDLNIFDKNITDISDFKHLSKEETRAISDIFVCLYSVKEL